MKLFWQYLGQRRGVLLAYALFAGLFCASFALYQVPVPVWRSISRRRAG